jgi:hypothetical protein
LSTKHLLAMELPHPFILSLLAFGLLTGRTLGLSAVPVAKDIDQKSRLRFTLLNLNVALTPSSENIVRRSERDRARKQWMKRPTWVDSFLNSKLRACSF